MNASRSGSGSHFQDDNCRDDIYDPYSDNDQAEGVKCQFFFFFFFVYEFIIVFLRFTVNRS